ncbi:unnamed protein product, partial [Ectocarpus sp. 8 AP-2014]
RPVTAPCCTGTTTRDVRRAQKIAGAKVVHRAKPTATKYGNVRAYRKRMWWGLQDWRYIERALHTQLETARPRRQREHAHGSAGVVIVQHEVPGGLVHGKQASRRRSRRGGLLRKVLGGGFIVRICCASAATFSQGRLSESRAPFRFREGAAPVCVSTVMGIATVVKPAALSGIGTGIAPPGSTVSEA